ncbi:MAG: YraN family protein [Cyclobacteriaceae bacterium]
MSAIDRKGIGDSGEQKAADFLLDKGYEICAMNYRHKRGEIDLIVKKNTMMVFVEVKTRNNLKFGTPEQFVSERQQEVIIETANAYVSEVDWQGPIRFDIIAIVPEKEVVHFEDAFY